jgi:hypothetical protein
MRIKTTMLAALLVLAASGAGAQQVYRCGSTYSQQPCPGGATVQVEDPRTQAEVHRADAQTQRQAKAADAMEKARLQQEAKAAPANILPQGGQVKKTQEAPSDRKADAKGQAKAKKPDYFIAVSPKKASEGPDRKKTAKSKQSS